jgi:hypothetical protein
LDMELPSKSRRAPAEEPRSAAAQEDGSYKTLLKEMGY